MQVDQHEVTYLTGEVLKLASPLRGNDTHTWLKITKYVGGYDLLKENNNYYLLLKNRPFPGFSLTGCQTL
jgi:hypothetical protein